jgi:histone H4
MSIHTEEDRRVLNIWLGEKEASEVIKDEDAGKHLRDGYALCEEPCHGDQAKILRGGGTLSEGHDHFYQTHFIASVDQNVKSISGPIDDPSQTASYHTIKVMKGLHQHPDIPVVSAKGVVSVDLEAARRYFAEYFGVECEIIPTSDVKSSVDSPFRFKLDSDSKGLLDDIVSQQKSLTMYHHHHISLRNALPPEMGEEKTTTIGVAAVGKISCSTDALDLLALEDPCEMQKAAFIENMQDEAELLSEEIEEEETGLKSSHPYIRGRVPRLGQGGPMRHRKVLRDNIQGLLECDFQRILRRAGIPMELGLIFEEMRGISRVFLENVIRSAVTFCEFSRRKIVTVDDVLASRPLECRLLGFGGPHGVRNVWSTMVTRVLKQIHPETSIGPKALSVLNDVNSIILEELLLRAKDLVAKKPSFKTYPTLEEWTDADGYDQRAFGYKVVNAGPESHPDAFQTKIYTREYEFDEDQFIRLEDPLPVINSRDIQTAVRLYMPGALAKHAVTEGGKASTRFTSRQRKGVSSAFAAGLQNSPVTVALIASRMTMDFPITEEAAVYLAAVMEYITAEVLELSGNASRDCGSELISCRNIMKAICCDEELNSMFKSCVIREGGVLPDIHSVICTRMWSDQTSDSNDESSPFEKLMIAKAKEAATAANHNCAVFVDPRTGLHMMVVAEKKEFICHVSELDIISQVLQEERRMMAVAALSESEIAMMKAEGYHILPKDSEGENETWALESLNRIHIRRLAEISREQNLTDYTFNCVSFQRLVSEIGQDYKTDLKYTQEAMEAMQAYLESYLVNLAKEAFLAAIAAGRSTLHPKDLQLARRLRSEINT